MVLSELIEYFAEIQAYASELEELLNAETVEVCLQTSDEDKIRNDFVGSYSIYIRKDGDNKFTRYFTDVGELDKYISDLVRVAKLAKGEEV